MTGQVLIVGTFAGVLLLTLGLYWLLVVRVEEQTTTQIRKRLKRPSAGLFARTVGLAKEATEMSKVASLNRVLLRASSITTPLTTLIEQANAGWTVGFFLLLTGLLATGGYLIITLLTHYRGIGAIVGTILAFAPYLYLRIKRSRRLLKFEEGFPEAIDLIARALRAGHAFTGSLSMVAEEIPDPVGPEFKLLYDRQNFGMPLQDALRAFADRIPLLDAKFFATAVLTQREAGGNLSEVLDNLARVVRERFKVKRQIRVVSAHARMTGFVLVALPPLTGVATMFVSRENVRTLVTDPLGIKMIVAAMILQVTGGLIVKKLVNIEY
jgi:tight adherence protein B